MSQIFVMCTEYSLILSKIQMENKTVHIARDSESERVREWKRHTQRETNTYQTENR